MPPKPADSETRDERDTRAWLETQWAQEPTVQVYIEPEPDEEKLAAAHGGQYPPRPYQINGVQLYWHPGTQQEMPRSHAQLYFETRKRRPFQNPAGVNQPGILEGGKFPEVR